MASTELGRTPQLTLNLGLRYDVSVGSRGERLSVPFFLPEGRSTEWVNFQPRLGFADSRGKTVFRGGFGKYFSEITDQWATHLSGQSIAIQIPNDGRPDFASNPFNGPAPTYEQASTDPRFNGRRSLTVLAVDDDFHTVYSLQASLGFQRQLGDSMAIEADFVNQSGRRTAYVRNGNRLTTPRPAQTIRCPT